MLFLEMGKCFFDFFGEGIYLGVGTHYIYIYRGLGDGFIWILDFWGGFWVDFVG